MVFLFLILLVSYKSSATAVRCIKTKKRSIKVTKCMMQESLYCNIISRKLEHMHLFTSLAQTYKDKMFRLSDIYEDHFVQ